MSADILSKKTRNEFREYLVSNWVLRQIENEFDGGNIVCDTNYDPPCSGQRRTLIEQFYHSVDFANWTDVRKVLNVYASILAHIEHYYPNNLPNMTKWLEKDGFAYKDGSIEPIVNIPHIPALKTAVMEFNSDYMNRQIQVMHDAVESNPDMAVGIAKEFIETCCKTILKERGEEVDDTLEIPKLVRQTFKQLQLLPEDIKDHAKGADTIKRLLSNLASVPQGLAELRNLYGWGHGKEGRTKSISPRHAKLAVGAASTLAIFLFETHRDRNGNTA